MEKRKTGRCEVPVTVRMTVEERALLQSLSDRTGMNISQAIKTLIRAADVQPIETWRPVLTGGRGS